MSFSIVLFDRFEGRSDLLPLVATRPIGNLRVGAFTLDQKWQVLTNQDVSYLTVDYLQSKFTCNPQHNTVILVDANVLPTKELLHALVELEFNCNLVDEQGKWLAVKIQKEDLPLITEKKNLYFDESYLVGKISRVRFLEDIFLLNAKEISADVENLKLQKSSLEAYPNISFHGEDIYMHDSVEIEQASIDTREGLVYLDENVIVEPGVIIKGPAYIGKGSRLKSGTVIYPNVTIGPNCTVSGELNNTVIWGNSAKGHYGYLGCAVIGEGCNLGAGTTNSNLKNDWNSVKLYSYKDNNFRNTGLLKCGVFIGDHSMLAISSKINTGTVIGVGAQVAMSNFIPKFVPDFSWFTDSKQDGYIFLKFMEMMDRKALVKKESFTNEDKEILHYIYKHTEQLRNY